MSYPSSEKIIHLHPTRLCNFECLHCYSVSGPKTTGLLKAEELLKFTEKMWVQGYTHVSISGGEPTVYSELIALCSGLTRQGFEVSLITNGWNLAPLYELCENESVSFIAVSFDGDQDLHDRIRGRPGSYSRALDCLGKITKLGMSSGAVVSITNPSLALLPRILEAVAATGAKKIQLHPIASIGRAFGSQLKSLVELEDEALVRLIAMTAVFSKLWPQISIQCDAALSATLNNDDLPKLNDPISPIVVKDNGSLLPIAYGVSETLIVGTITDTVDAPRYDKKTISLLKDTLSNAETKVATAFYSDFVHLSYNS